MLRNLLLLVTVAVAAFCVSGGCGTVDNPKRDLERAAEKDDGRGIPLWSSEPTGLIHDDPYGSDVVAWYKQSYVLWGMEHKGLLDDIKKKNKLGIRNTLNRIEQVINQMQRALSPDRQEKLAEVLDGYRKIAKQTGSSFVPSSLYIILRNLKRIMWDEFDPAKVELIVPDSSGGDEDDEDSDGTSETGE